MPKLGKKHYAYTKAGRTAYDKAKALADKKKKKKKSVKKKKK